VSADYSVADEDVDECVGVFDDCGVCNGPGAIYDCGCTEIPEGDCDCEGNQLDALGICGGLCDSDEDGDGVCDSAVLGCMDESACNYEPSANVDDGSCADHGCNDPSACNFDGAAVCDDACVYPVFGSDCGSGAGVCGPGTFWNANTQQCEVSVLGDFDGDGCVCLSDLLIFLTHYNTCVNPHTVSFSCGIDKVDYHGYEYTTVLIGGECWFAENLQTATFLNGDTLPSGLSGAVWSNTNSPAMSVYGEGDGDVVTGGALAEDEAFNLARYGRLYNGWAKNDPRGLCPAGWHVSTTLDWDALTAHFGGYPHAGNALKGVDSLHPSRMPSGAQHLGALPGGYRDQQAGGFYYRGSRAGFWAAESTQHRSIYGGAQMTTTSVSLQDGYAIRCVMD
jgi:uncharacterized protein (TIGR02145 family)